MQIHLLEGFRDDEVIVRVDGAERQATGVTTRNQIGFAKTLAIDVSTERVEVEVALPHRAIAASITVERASEESVRANLTETGELRLSTSREPLRLA
jgi:hypothetical protein